MSKLFATKIIYTLIISANRKTEMSILPGMKAPDFAGTTWHNNAWKDIQSSDYAGKWLVLFFYPMDFGYISPSELLALEEKRNELLKINCHVLGVSTDTALIHQKFCAVEPKDGGVNGIDFPLLEDPDHVISNAYGVLKDGSGHTFRSYFIIDAKGIVRARVSGDLPVALGIEEIPKKVGDLQAINKTKGWYQNINNE